MRYLCAFDKFKDCMSAADASLAAAEALRGADPAAEVAVAPLTDGGEGFASILTGGVGGRLERVEATGPSGGRRHAQVGFVEAEALPEGVRHQIGVRRGVIAIVEMAEASGLCLLREEERDPWRATSRGTGACLLFAAERGASAIVLGIGGSATCDLGLGALEALGLGSVSANGGEFSAEFPADWERLSQFRGGVKPLPPLYIACDVVNPLLGAKGVAAVFGPQKGLRPSDIGRMDAALERVGRLLLGHLGKSDGAMSEPSSGAAGGIGFGLRAAYGAQFVPGFDFVSRWMNLEAKLAWADVVLTGEGRFDAGSLSGKGPGGVVRRALELGKPVAVFAGCVDVDEASVRRCAPDAEVTPILRRITPAGLPLAESLLRGREFLSLSVAAFVRQVNAK